MGFFKKQFLLSQLNWQDLMEYRFDIAIYTFSGVATPLIMMAIWLSIVQVSDIGYSRDDLITYYLGVILVGQLTSAWSAWFVSEDIRKGNLSNYLLRPYSYVGVFANQNFTEKILKALFLSPLLVMFVLTIHADITVTRLLLFALSVVLGAILYFLLDFSMGLAAFWMAESNALTNAWEIGYDLLSGRLVPLSFFPASALSMINFLPFRFTLSFPLEILLGKLPAADILQGLLVELVWLTAAGILYAILWTRGTKVYGASGA